MADLTDVLPSFLFSSPSFQDFIIASERVKPGDSLVLKDGRLEKKCAHEPNEERLNSKTWKAFQRAVDQEFTSKKKAHICARYGIDWTNMTQSAKPLKREYVERFGVGAANPYTFNLKESLWPFHSLRNQSPKEIHRLYEHATRNRFLGALEDPSRLHGGAKDPHENFTYDMFRVDKRRANLYRGIEDLVSRDFNIPRLHPYYSRLSMGIISLLETKKEIQDIQLVIPAPGVVDGTLEYYKVHKIIAGGGLTAVALTPVSQSSHLSPIILFRCTKQNLGQTDFIPSNLNNIEKHIGESGYKVCYEELCALMKDVNFTQKKKITVVPYSQGGAYAGYFVRDFLHQLKEVVGFNFVGNEANVIESIATQINAMGKNELPPPIYIHRNVCNEEGTLGDWVNKIGKKHIGWGLAHPNARVTLYEWLVHDQVAPKENPWDNNERGLWGRLHSARPMDSEVEEYVRSKFHPHWPYRYKMITGPTNCNRILDTYKRDPTLEDLRNKVGTEILYKWIEGISSFLDFLLRLFGIEFFKKNTL